MKIAAVYPRGSRFSPALPTAQDLVLEGLVRYSAHRATTRVFAADIASPFEGIDFHGLPPADGTRNVPTERIAAALADFAPDVIWVQAHIAVAVRLARRFKGVPVLVHRHGVEPPVWSPRAWRRIPQLAALAGAIYVSETAARSAAYPFVRKFVVPNAIDTQAIQPAVEREQAIVYAGRFVASKGVLPMCAALAEALPRLPGWRLRIFAIHTSDEPETVATAQGMLAPLGDRAVWRTDASPAEVMAAMSRAAIAIAPSLAPEGFGRAVLEAMAGGAVVVAAPVAAFREVIGDSGVILPHVDQETIAGAVLELARNDAQRATVAKAGRARAIAEFDIRASAKKLDAVFAAVTGGQAGTARPR